MGREELGREPTAGFVNAFHEMDERGDSNAKSSSVPRRESSLDGMLAALPFHDSPECPTTFDQVVLAVVGRVVKPTPASVDAVGNSTRPFHN